MSLPTHGLGQGGGLSVSRKSNLDEKASKTAQTTQAQTLTHALRLQCRIFDVKYVAYVELFDVKVF